MYLFIFACIILNVNVLFDFKYVKNNLVNSIHKYPILFYFLLMECLKYMRVKYHYDVTFIYLREQSFLCKKRGL